MKLLKSILFTCILGLISSSAQAEPQMEMHRLQATTKDPSGWYLATSTQGSFSALIPLPFNDFTVTDNDPKNGTVKTHTVGAKSSEGIKFSVTESPIIEGKSLGDLATFPDQFKKPGQSVQDIDTAPFAGCPSVALTVKGPTSGAHMRCLKTPKSLIIAILEYPLEHAKAAEEFRDKFLSSLKLNQTAPEETAKGSQPTQSKPVSK
jgi:hypothetical protein